MSYVHLTTSERVKIETYLELGFSMRKIAQHLGRQPSTISRELKRNPSYNAINAGLRYEMQKKNCGARTLFSTSLGSCILSKLRETRSPEQIAGRLFHEQGPSYSTIYRWIYKGFIKSDLGVLRQKGKRQKPRETRGRFNIGLPISKRPSDVRGRETFGHWSGILSYQDEGRQRRVLRHSSNVKVGSISYYRWSIVLLTRWNMPSKHFTLLSHRERFKP